MKTEFEEYLKSIGIGSELFLTRIETLMEIHSKLCQDEILDIFVDDYIKEDGTREYEGITFFSNEYSFGSTNFLTTDNFVFSNLKKSTVFVAFKSKDYDFKKATALSRLNVIIGYETTNFKGNYKASKENCDVLRRIALKYMKPNLK